MCKYNYLDNLKINYKQFRDLMLNVIYILNLWRSLKNIIY